MAKTANSDTPLMQQHRAIKQKYPDAILLFRVGDFYETFGPDAIVASQVLVSPSPKGITVPQLLPNLPVFRTMHWIPICTSW